MRAARIVALLAAAALWAPAAVNAQVRVANWNITNWSASNVTTRGSAFQTSLYGMVPAGMLYAGQQFAPDVLIAEEITQGGTPSSYPIASAYQTTGQANVDAFLNLLNTASGSPGDWAAAPYVANQGDTGNALFYRSTRVQLIDITTLGCGFANAPCGAGGATIDVGSGAAQSPRDNQRWRIRLLGYGATAGSEIYLYGGHFKASDGSAEQARKVPEAQRIRSDAALLPAGANYILGADLNVQTSARNYYQILVGSGTGQFIDPISRPGGWNAECTFRNIHTQEPTSSATGGMDDRHDQLLISAPMRDGQGLSYIPFSPGGNILAPYVSAIGACTNSGAALSQNPNPTSTNWFDANHSYRCWGNDGNHFNIGVADTATTAVNTMVGQAIAQALVTTCAGNGHLPVFLDLQVPAKLGAPSGTINLGTVAQNSATSYTLQITNAAEVSRFSKDGTGWGIDGLTYSLAISSSSFSIPSGLGPFERPATSPAAANSHSIVLDTSTAGSKNATVTITSDDPDNPTRVLTILATVQSTTPTGACCATATGACTLVLQTNCSSGSTWDGSASCTAPNPCPQPTGACCTGTACSITTLAACSGAFQGTTVTCGAPGNPTTCCPANFNQTGGITTGDIFDFLNAWFAGNTAADFDHSGQLAIQDIFQFLNAWFSGC